MSLTIAALACPKCLCEQYRKKADYYVCNNKDRCNYEGPADGWPRISPISIEQSKKGI